ncbi:MAG: nuclear transport factor 2 family protein [bacterium]|nr:nuclear transport factor 2 family protein [bacterium]
MISRLDTLLDWYQTLGPETVDRINDFYTEDAFFKDPFNEFRSREGIRQTYNHMFETLDNPRFFIKSTVMEGRQAFAVWSMEFGFRGKTMSIHGCSHFDFAEDGRVQSHRDYWDAAEEFYEKLPVLGWLLKRIKQKVKTRTTQA